MDVEPAFGAGNLIYSSDLRFPDLARNFGHTSLGISAAGVGRWPPGRSGDDTDDVVGEPWDV